VNILSSIKRVHLLLIMALVAGLALVGQAVPAHAAGKTFTVNSTVDAPDATPGDGKCETASGNNICTLRAAIMESNTLVGADTINLQAGATYVLTRAGDDDTALNGDLDITDDLTINGAGAGSSIIDGNGSVTHDRVFDIEKFGVRVNLSGVTIQHGKDAASSAGGIQNGYGTLTLTNSVVKANIGVYGGGIRNEAILTLNNSTVSGNTATDYGGGIMNSKTLTLNNSTISGNSTGGEGGGIENWSAATLVLNNSIVSGNSTTNGAGGIFNWGAATLNNSTISGNSAGGDAGGIFNTGTGNLTLNNSTISGNSATSGSGGAIFNNSAATLTNSTISGNSAGGSGGGISNEGAATLTNSTISGNSANYYGGAVYSYGGTVDLHNVTIAHNVADGNKDGLGDGGGVSIALPSIVNARNTLIANNVHQIANGFVLDDCKGTLTSEDYNLILNTTGCTIGGAAAHNKIGVNAQLGTLQNNGGSTATHALLAGSPAIDAGNPNGCKDNNNAALTTDQRGYARPAGAACDIGAYEYGSALAKQSQTISFAALPDKLVSDPPFQISATASSGLPVTFTASGKCSVNGSTVTLSGKAGSCTITAHQAGSANYNPAPDVARSFAINKLDQTISFAPLSNKTVGDPSFSVSASASSGLPVTFTASGKCSVNGTTVTLSGQAGSCTITAHQAGNSQYNPAPDVARSFAINDPAKQNQTISFAPLPNKTVGDAPFAISATASSGLAVTFTASGKCSVSGNTITLTSAGSCTITAHQPGDASFNAAQDVAQSFLINGSAQNGGFAVYLPVVAR
jgi:CSLREA domain-containing protein